MTLSNRIRRRIGFLDTLTELAYKTLDEIAVDDKKLSVLVQEIEKRKQDEALRHIPK